MSNYINLGVKLFKYGIKINSDKSDKLGNYLDNGKISY